MASAGALWGSALGGLGARLNHSHEVSRGKAAAPEAARARAMLLQRLVVFILKAVVI